MVYILQYGGVICSICNKEGVNKKTCPFDEENLKFLLDIKENKIIKNKNVIDKLDKFEKHNKTNTDGLTIQEILEKKIEQKIEKKIFVVEKKDKYFILKGDETKLIKEELKNVKEIASKSLEFG